LIWPHWLITYGGSKIRNSNNNSSGNVEEEDMYRGNGKELVLASLSDSYLELEAISVSASRPSSCLTLYYLLTTFTTDYCLKEDVNNFDLRMLFYSKQDLKDICCSLA